MSQKQKEVAKNACHRLQCTLQHDVPKKAEFDSECLCFDKFPERRFELQTCSQFYEEFLLLQLKCDLLVGSQDALIYLETPEIAKMLHNVYKDSCIGNYLYHSRFGLNVHGLRHRSKPYRLSPSW
jgi:hypothetical protein